MKAETDIGFFFFNVDESTKLHSEHTELMWGLGSAWQRFHIYPHSQ